MEETLAVVTCPAAGALWLVTFLPSRPDSWDIFLMIVAGMKLLRASFCHPAHQFVHLSFTAVFFRFDYKALSEGFLLDFFLMSILFSKASQWALLFVLKCSRCTPQRTV